MNGGNAHADDAARWARVCAVLDAVLDASPAQRTHVLAAQCGGDDALREEVEALLRAEAAADARLEQPAAGWAAALAGDEPDDADIAVHHAGERIGAWRLIGEIGRGGMGTVWLAERADGDFTQRVAMKLLKRGVDSDAILARFVAERRILARLEHPHIARLVDGGITAQGHPWFAMEHVDGQPITRWCDARTLDVAARLRLFLDVADAVQHAHRQLVVHRDLKPSNILVDAAGNVKLLDFGIAKLLDAQDERADSATLTRIGGRMLTPEYAAPEQLRGGTITTATDVHAMGVLLYELLAGKRPTAPQRDTVAGFAVDAQPAPRASTLGDDDAAAARGTTARRLARQLRGDLDTILLRAVHAEPERRYGTAEALRDDLQRHLDGQPILARPDSAWYRARKFVARNRLAVAAAALLALSLFAGLAATAWQAREAQARAREAEQQARRAEQVKAFLIDIFQAGGPQQWRGNEPTARELLDAGAKRVDAELKGDPALHAEMLAVIGTLTLQQGNVVEAERLLRISLHERARLLGTRDPAYADSLNRLAEALLAKGDGKGAEAQAKQALQIFLSRPGMRAQASESLDAISSARLSEGDIDGAIELRRRSLAMQRAEHGEFHVDVSDSLRALGALLVEDERYDEAAPLLAESLAIDERLSGKRSVRYASGLDTQANLFYLRGQTAQAADTYRDAAEIYRQAGDNGNLEDAISHHGVALCRLGRFDAAIARLRESIALVRRDQPPGSQWLGIRMISLGGCMTDAGRAREAEPVLREGLGLLERTVGDTHPWTRFALRKLAESLAAQGKPADARPVIERAYMQYRQQERPDSAEGADSLRVLSAVRFALGERQAALAQAREAQRVLEQTHGAGHPQAAAAALNVAELELASGDAAAAAPRFAALARGLAQAGNVHRALTARLLYGEALVALGRAREAQADLRKVVAERRVMYGDGNPKVVEADAVLRRCLSAMRQPDATSPSPAGPQPARATTLR